MKNFCDKGECEKRILAALLREAREMLADGFESDGPVEAEHSVAAKELVARIDAAIT